MAEGEARGEARGIAKGWAVSLVEVIEMRFGPLPPDLNSAMSEERDIPRLKEWLKSAIFASSLADFRQLVQR